MKKPGYIPVPKYFFVAVLKKEYNQKTKQYSYSAFGYWFLHENKAFDKSDLLGNYVVNIKTLEDKTGIDFFCNLPDDFPGCGGHQEPLGIQVIEITARRPQKRKPARRPGGFEIRRKKRFDL